MRRSSTSVTHPEKILVESEKILGQRDLASKKEDAFERQITQK